MFSSIFLKRPPTKTDATLAFPHDSGVWFGLLPEEKYKVCALTFFINLFKRPLDFFFSFMSSCQLTWQQIKSMLLQKHGYNISKHNIYSLTDPKRPKIRLNKRWPEYSNANSTGLYWSICLLPGRLNSLRIFIILRTSPGLTHSLESNPGINHPNLALLESMLQPPSESTPYKLIMCTYTTFRVLHSWGESTPPSSGLVSRWALWRSSALNL